MMTHGDLPSFGSLLKRFRTRERLSQQQVAQRLGLHRNAIGRWERGDLLPAYKGIVLELARHLRLDESETRQLLEASLTGLAPYWLVPLPRNPFFTGREEILEALHTQMSVNHPVAITQSSALHGLGGVGKTQIALEYAYRYGLQYSAVGWMGAETQESLVTGLRQFAQVLGVVGPEETDQQRVIAAVQHWLSTHSQWLLIWDNVEDLELLRRFVPATRAGALLFTTRHRVLGTLAAGIDVFPMEQEEGMLFLLRRAKLLAPEAGSQQLDQWVQHHLASFQATINLVEELGGLPLALDQAGAYLEETQCGLPAYLDLFRSQRATLLKLRGDRSHAHPDSVSATFTLSIRATIHHHPVVQDLLHVCALLSPDAIPEELFCQGAEHLGAQLEAICRDTLAWNQVIATACAYSLLSRQPEEQTLSVHRLVQAVLLDTMSDQERERWRARVIAALEVAFPEVQRMSRYAAWKQCERLLPHALLCLQRPEVASQGLSLASLAHKTACYLLRAGRYAQAEPLFLRALQIREQALGPEHPEATASLNRLGELYWDQGKYAQAEPLWRRALQLREQALGPEHPEVAASLNNLAILLQAQGKYTEAEPLYLRTLQIWEQALGPEHPGVAVLLNNLGELYWDQDKYAQAEPLLRRAFRIWEQALGPEHPELAEPLYLLANLLRAQDKYPEAEPLYLRALEIRKQTLGPEHPKVADPLTGLANLRRDQCRYAEAERLYLRALSIREQHLGQHHPDTAQTLHDLALLHEKQDKLREAIALAERALSIRVQSLGEAHPKTVASRTLYTQLVHKQTAGAEKAAAKQEGEAKGNLRNESCQPDQASLSLPKGTDATSSAGDPLQAFLDACCDLHPRAWCRSADLWRTYQQWVEERHERYPLSRGAFIAQLKEHGLRADRTRAARIWRGIALVENARDAG